MIQGRLLKQIDEPAGRAAPGVTATEDDPADPAVNNRTGAHGAGLLRDVEITVCQPPVAHGLLCLSQGKHLGMGGCVAQGFDLIVRTGDNGAILHDDCPYRDLFSEIGFLGLAHRLPHEKGIAGEIDDGFIIGMRRYFVDHGGDSADKVFAVWPKRIDNAGE